MINTDQYDQSGGGFAMAKLQDRHTIFLYISQQVRIYSMDYSKFWYDTLLHVFTY
jgi:hypothetical protein